ncbi:MAG: beta-ketoacyl synthase N-terminal-like domain-containing protein, partial [Planctomycetota bacterium]
QMAGSKTGVYVGIGGSDYSKTPVHNASDFLSVIDGYMGTGNALSIAANRLSYILDLHGPSLAVDTACSSSSVAVHLAVESLRRGECTAAIAGGVNAILTPETSIAFSNAKMLSPDGHCRPFDSRANGYVRGEGCGLVLLKRLDDAWSDGDDVLAVLRATSVNQDGRTSGISAPNGESQKRCLRAAHAQAGVTPDDLGYIEAHGTGTPLGDPIEMQALAEVFPDRGGDAPPLLVTSVKANIGHTETVSGIAGLIKVVLMLRNGEAPPQAHLQELNPHIKLTGSRVRIPTEVTPWTERRLAGVSSFGFGGTNTHLLVSAADDAAASEAIAGASPDGNQEPGPPSVLKLSGKTRDAVAEQARQFADRIESDDAIAAADACFTANTGRCDLPQRAV